MEIIPEAAADDWEQWLSDDDEDEDEVPDFAHPVGGHPSLVRFRDFEIE